MGCRTVNEVISSLDWCLDSEAVNDRGGHYNRPDGTRGPVAKYPFSTFNLIFAINRYGNEWVISSTWLERKGRPPIQVNEFWEGLMVGSGRGDELMARKSKGQ